MADFFTHFSCVLDVGTPDNAARALKLYQAFMEGAAHEEVPPDGFLLSIEPEHGATRLWIRDDVTGDPQQALRRGFRSYRPLGLPMGELPLAAARQRLRRRRPCARPGGRRDDRLDRHQRLACAHPRSFARQATSPLNIQCGGRRLAA
jgi:hypothetical protein